MYGVVFCLREESSDDVGYEYAGWGLSIRPKAQTSKLDNGIFKSS